ncbi:ankyrin repeat domain-containing protein [Aspergillus mulundensis]|uniref:Uncharacterized protein n=1 Tax=Aspergillus mulundensis TaxID=1810919 RepID=A0A3D8QAZ9_9EURO|nr:hypothetical protein DSM5745_11212 [Aspergillus mulundensis]RDW59006.1 hypothetical protein DSM5745_11212 [Aspergillus mulundensis]
MSASVDKTTKAIFAAIENDDLLTFMILTARRTDGTRVNLEAKNEHGYTMLEYAVIRNRPDLVMDLCQMGANLKTNWLEPKGWGNNYTGSLICFAAWQGFEESIEWMLIYPWNKADVNERKHKPDGDTPLIEAIRGNHRGTVSVLLDKGADPNLLVGLHGTALRLACSEKFRAEKESLRVGVVRALLKAKADVNLPAHSPPLAAAIDCKRSDSYVEIIELLLRRKDLDVNYTGVVPGDNQHSPVTALTQSIGKREWAIAEMIVGSRPELDVNKGNPLELAVQSGADGEGLVRMLLATGRLSESSYQGAVETAIRMNSLAANAIARAMLKEWAAVAADMKTELARLREVAEKVSS